MADALRWGIVGTGAIASTFARSLPHSTTGDLVAVGSRTQATADAFAAAHGVERGYDSYDALFADATVDAVYIATPHPSHADLAVRAARHGKHLLVEKPLGMNTREARAVVDAARAADVFLMEAFMYRCHPQTARLVELLAAGTIGDVRLVRASFGFHAPYNAASRLFDNALGGGSILDVGCYPASIACLVARVTGQLDAGAIEVRGSGHVGESSVDEWAAATVDLGGGMVAQLSTGVRLLLDNTVEIFGSDGSISIPSPWLAHDVGHLVIRRADGAVEELTIATPPAGLYGLEADVVAANIERREAPAMPWEDTLLTASILDGWLRAVGVSYPGSDPS